MQHMTCATHRDKLVTDIVNPLTTPNLSGVTELLVKSAWHKTVANSNSYDEQNY